MGEKADKDKTSLYRLPSFDDALDVSKKPAG